MSAAVAVMRNLYSYEGSAQLYEALSVVSRVASSVQNKANVIRLAYALTQGSRALDTLFGRIHGIMEGKIPVEPSTSTEDSPEWRLRNLSYDVERLGDTIDFIYHRMQRVGLLNNSIASMPLRRMYAHREELLNLADWLHLASQEEEVTALFERGARERERGEFADLEQVE